jgi:twitching motility protein PilT
MDINELLTEAHEVKASDLHLIASSPPLVRVDGSLKKLNEHMLTAEDVKQAFVQVTTQEQRDLFEQELELYVKK